MSKIAEEKAKIAFREFLARHNWSGNIELGYKMGYDQAMQDFLEKACEWLSKNARNYYSAYATSDKLIDDFRRIMLEKE